MNLILESAVYQYSSYDSVVKIFKQQNAKYPSVVVKYTLSMSNYRFVKNGQKTF